MIHTRNFAILRGITEITPGRKRSSEDFFEFREPLILHTESIDAVSLPTCPSTLKESKSNSVNLFVPEPPVTARACAENKFSFSGFNKKTTTQRYWLFIFAFSPPLFFLFFCHIIFFFCWAFSVFNLVGKVFGKALRILGSDERKGSWVLEQDFHGNFRAPVSGQCYMVFLPVRSPWLNRAHYILVWFERSLKLADKVVLDR